jgi:hypothetical protein
VPAGLVNVGTYLTDSELTGNEPMAERDIIARLERMSAADCLLALAQLGTRMIGLAPLRRGLSRDW